MDEKKLIKLIIEKNEDGLIKFIENYAGLMKSVISRILYEFLHLHEEVLNDSLLSVWNNIKYYDNEKSSLKNWCASIARYRAIDALRIEIKHKTVPIDEVINISTVDELNPIYIEEILNHLCDEDKRLFVQLFIEGKTYEELSQELEISKNALYARVKRGRQKLKKEFQGGESWKITKFMNI